MTKYSAEYFCGGKWKAVGVFNTMTEAEIALLTSLDTLYYPIRVVPVEHPKP